MHPAAKLPLTPSADSLLVYVLPAAECMYYVGISIACVDLDYETNAIKIQEISSHGAHLAQTRSLGQKVFFGTKDNVRDQFVEPDKFCTILYVMLIFLLCYFVNVNCHY